MESSIAARQSPKKFYRTLYFQVVVAIFAGIILGYGAPQTAIAMKPLGDGFIKLIKMLIAPIIFCTVVNGISGMRNMRNAGRVGLKALLYFEAMSTLALVIGLTIANLYQPGAGMHIDPKTLDAKAIAPYTSKALEHHGADMLLQLIPNTLADAFVQGDMLQVLLVAILFAMALVTLGQRTPLINAFIHQFSEVLFRIIGLIVRLAPLGAFGAMAFTIGQYGIQSLSSLAHLMLAFYATCIVFVSCVLGVVMRACELRLWPFLKYIREEIFIVLGTSSSEAALPRMIEKMTALGCSRSVVGMVIPAGYSFNLDGTSIYLTMAALFIAQATGVQLTLGEEIEILGLLLLTSKGAAGVTGSGFVVLAGTLSTVSHIPVEGLALILGIDRFMSEARAITNLIGNGVATIVVSRWEHALEITQAKAMLR